MKTEQTNKQYTQFEISRLRKESLHKLRIFEVLTFAAFLIVTVALACMLPWGIGGDSERISGLMLGIGTAIALQAAFMFRYGFLRVRKDQEINNDLDDGPFRGWRFTFSSPVAAILIVMPWIVSGTFNADDVNTVGALFFMVLLFGAAVLIGFLIVPFIFLPIELIAKGLYNLIVKRDASKIIFLYIGGFIALVTTFIFVMAAATNTYYPGIAGGAAGIPALFGIPGAYDVEDEFLLWVARVITAVLITAGVVAYILSKRDTKQKSTRQK